MNDIERRKNIKEFISFWTNKDNLNEADIEEKNYTDNKNNNIGERKFYQTFWNMLLREIFEVKSYDFIEYEKSVIVDNSTKFIDGYIKDTRVLIEQKGSSIDLDKEELQSGNIKLTPAEQARRYVRNLSFNDRAKWMVVSNFKEIRIFDLNKTDTSYEVIQVKDLEKEWYRLKFLVDVESEDIKKEMEVSVEAGRLVGKLYDALYTQYENIENEESQKSLNVLCVRIVFCLYAEDAGIFDNKQMFYEYLKSFKKENFREAIINLFHILNQRIEDRDKYLNNNLLSFPYVNGGLFSKEIEIPKFNDEIIDLILNRMSEEFDWSNISPTIFGAIFESTLNPNTRRAGGMHYTSIENIHKVIDPLFLNDIKKEFEDIKQIKQKSNRNEKLKIFRDKISSLKFLDPAAGSGNFLTETYISLRKIENEIIKLIYTIDEGRKRLGNTIDDVIIKVSISQFYGIEINDFATTVANTALWIAEYQMLKETEDILSMYIDYLPLKNYNHIIEGNALILNWNEVIDSHIDFIMGNPPFVGKKFQTQEQKNDLVKVFGNIKRIGTYDYVCGWYKKCAEFIKETNTKCALVSTNSITQGELVGALWSELYKENIQIDFAYRSFVWNSESNEKAKVHCVIIGFSYNDKEANNTKDLKFSNNIKLIYENNRPKIVKNINPYLIDADDIFIESRSNPICNVLKITDGNVPIDGNFLKLELDEYEQFKNEEPNSIKYIKKLVGSEEFINKKDRYVLWLVDCPPNELKKMPLVMDRVKKVKEFRLSSNRVATLKLAEQPWRFEDIRNPKSALIIPRVSSELRRYIPMGFIDENTIALNAVLLLADATLYHFGILTSNVHMAWMRAVAGRLKSDYRYSKDIVYNNFIWPNVLFENDVKKILINNHMKLRPLNEFKEHKKKIEQTAKNILDVRKKYKNSSLADLYDNTTMPDDLRKAHVENDKAVMKAYNFNTKHSEFTEEDCVRELMKLYKIFQNK